MKKAVVIGGSGFLGSHIADELTQRGFKVTIVDKEESSWKTENQTMVVGDFSDDIFLNDIFNGVSYVYHFGGIADIGESRQNPIEAVDINVLGTMKILKAIATQNIERFVYASTMYVYSPYGSFYRATKQAAEILIETCHEEYGLDYTILRFGSLYGPRSQNWNGLRSYISEILSTGKLYYRGTGKEKREYIYVKDAARLSVDILDEIHKNQAITLTGQQTFTSRDLMDMIFEITGVEGEVVFSGEKNLEEHYGITPYRYTPKRSKKLIPDEFVDLGEGILEIVEQMHEKQNIR